MHANDLFTQSCYEWRKVLRSKQTQQELKLHFTAVDKDRFNNKTLEDTGFHNVDNTTDDNTELLTGKHFASATTKISTLCKAISTQTTTKSGKFHENDGNTPNATGWKW